jgi:hypothetical protein
MSIWDCIAKSSHKRYTYKNIKGVIQDSNNVINEIMDILHTTEKGGMLDTLEKFYIFRETQGGNQIKDKLTIQSNPNFEVLIPNTTHREH